MVVVYTHEAYRTKTFTTEANSIIVGRYLDSLPPGIPATSAVILDLKPDTHVSQIHAQITGSNGTIWIEDRRSRNGTWVNGERISSKTRLNPDDQVQIGETILVLRTTALPEPEKAPVPDAVRSQVLTEVIDSVILPQPDDRAFGAISRRLSAFYDFGAELGTVESIEPLFKTVVDHLLKAIPGASRGALLILENDELLLKSHLPQGRPSVSMTLANQAIETRQAFIWRRASSDDGSMNAKTIIQAQTQSAMYAPLVWKNQILGVSYVDSPNSSDAFDEDDLRMLVAMSSQATLLVKFTSLQAELREGAEVRANMLRWFSPKVAKRLLDSGSRWLGGDRVHATILCSDIRGFTELTKAMQPGDVVKALNESFDVLVPILFSHDGTVDKFVGDSILAVFGSPEPDPQQWEHAIRAAMQMQEAMKLLNAQWRSEGRALFEIGIGIHTGIVLHGVIGSREHLEFTVIGDVVNRAARFCDGAGKGEVIISKEVYERAYRLTEVEYRTIKTKHRETEGDLNGYLVKALK